MKTKMFFCLLSVAFILSIVSCGGDDNGVAPCSTAYASELQDELTAFNTAAQNYAANPTSANCLAYKNAAQAYVNALEPYGNCATLTGQNRADWEAALQAAKDSVAAIQC